MWVIRYSENEICKNATRWFERKVGVGKRRTEKRRDGGTKHPAMLSSSIGMHNDQEDGKIIKLP